MDILNGVQEELIQIQEECLHEEREEWRRLFHMMIHPGKNVSGQ
jgi:hypothetical protein